MLEWIGEIAVAPDGTIEKIDAPVAAVLDFGSAVSKRSDLLPPLASIALEPPRHAMRASGVTIGGARGRVELLVVCARGTNVVRVGRRAPDTGDLEAATTATFRVLGDVAHDLGGPITGIVAAIDAMLEPGGPPDDGAELLHEARAEALRLVELVRRRREGMDTRATGATSIEARTVVGQVLGVLQGELVRAGLVAHLESEKDLPIRIDAGLFRGALTGLLLDAIEGSRRRGPEIHVRARIALGPPRALAIEVDDTGRGLSLDDLLHCGEIFRSSRRTGSGTGLAAVRQAMASAGGVFSIDSEAGVGTVATFVVPEASRIS